MRIVRSRRGALLTAVFLACSLVPPAAGLDLARAISADDARTQSFKLQSEGMRLYREGKYREATEAFQQVVAVNLNSFLAYFYLGASLIAERRYGEAIEPLKIALDLQPDYVQAHLALGDAYLKQGDASEARAEYLRALDLQPNYAAAHDGLGRLFESTGDDDAAEEQYRKALEINIAFADAYAHLGDLYLRKDRLDDAIELFLKSIAIQPDFSRGYTRLGVAYARERHYNEAIAALRKSQTLTPRDPDPYVALAQIYVELSSYHRAEVEIDAALSNAPDHPGAHLTLSALRRAQEDFAAAEASLSDLSERGIEDAQMRRAVDEELARLRTDAVRYDALKEAAEGVEARPSDLVALARFLSENGAHLRSAGLLREAADRVEAAQEAPWGMEPGPTEPAEELDPWSLRFEAGLELLAARRHADAMTLFESLATDPCECAEDERLRAAAYLNLGVARVALGLDREALEAFRESITFNPDDARARLYLGNALLRLERKEEARAAYVYFLERAGDAPEAARVQRLLLTLSEAEVSQVGHGEAQ